MPYKRISLWACFIEILTALITGIFDTLGLIFVLVIFVPLYYVLHFLYIHPATWLFIIGIYLLWVITTQTGSDEDQAQ